MMGKKLFLVLIGSLMLSMGLMSASSESLREQLDAQERRLTELEDALAGNPSGNSALAGVINRRFILKSQDGDYSMRLRGRVHFKGQFPMSGPADAASNEYLQLRRIRTGVEGVLAKYYEYKIEYDFGRGDAGLTDGFLGLTHFDNAKIRMGRFKVPFMAEELTSSNSIRFVERSMLARFAPSRQIGINVRGGGSGFDYVVGVFDGAVDGEYLYAGRVTMGTGNFRIGANALSENNDGSSSLLNLRTEFGTRWFQYDSDTRSDGSRTQFGADLSFWGTPFGFVAEYVMGKQDVAHPDRTGSLTNQGWYVQASYVLTGEKASSGGVTPSNDFVPGSGGLGAFEIAVRYASLSTDSDAHHFASSSSVESASAITAGLNWYMSRHAKFVLNYIHTTFDEKIGGDKSESGILFRTQYSF
jgi:phosphate-selective porin OprO and OprP